MTTYLESFDEVVLTPKEQIKEILCFKCGLFDENLKIRKPETVLVSFASGVKYSKLVEGCKEELVWKLGEKYQKKIDLFGELLANNKLPVETRDELIDRLIDFFVDILWKEDTTFAAILNAKQKGELDVKIV